MSVILSTSSSSSAKSLTQLYYGNRDSSKSTRSASLTLSRSIGRSGNIVRVSASKHVPPGRLGRVYLLFPISRHDPHTCRSLGTVRAICAPVSERTPSSRDPEIARLAIRCIYPADRDPDYADQRDLGLFPSVDCSPLLSPVDIGVVCHTAIIVDLDPAMLYFLEVTWLPMLIGGPNRGFDKNGCPRKPDRVRC